MRLAASLALASNNLTEAIKIALVAGDDSFPCQREAVRPSPADKFFGIGIGVEDSIDGGIYHTTTDDSSALLFRGKIHGVRSFVYVEQVCVRII